MRTKGYGQRCRFMHIDAPLNKNINMALFVREIFGTKLLLVCLLDHLATPHTHRENVIAKPRKTIMEGLADLFLFWNSILRV